MARMVGELMGSVEFGCNSMDRAHLVFSYPPPPQQKIFKHPLTPRSQSFNRPLPHRPATTRRRPGKIVGYCAVLSDNYPIIGNLTDTVFSRLKKIGWGGSPKKWAGLHHFKHLVDNRVRSRPRKEPECCLPLAGYPVHLLFPVPGILSLFNEPGIAELCHEC